MNNIIVQDVGAEKDAITSLRAPTHFGRPNWDRVFSSIVEKHPETDVGVVCTAPVLRYAIPLLTERVSPSRSSSAALPSFRGSFMSCRTSTRTHAGLDSTSAKVRDARGASCSPFTVLRHLFRITENF